MRTRNAWILLMTLCASTVGHAQQVTTIGHDILLPLGIAVDGAQTVYVTNRQVNNITKIAPDGSVSVFSSAYLGLHGVAVDASGNVLVADYSHVDKYPPSGAGMAPLSGPGSAYDTGYVDGAPNVARFNHLTGLALQPSTGVMYVGDFLNNRVRKVAPNGTVSTYPNPSATFQKPYGVAVDASGNVFISEYDNQLIRKITPAGNISVFAGSGSAGATNGMGTAASFNHPAGLATDASGNLWVADMGNNLIRKITPSGLVSTYAGSGSAGQADGLGAAASFNAPAAIAVGAGNTLYVADYQSWRVRKITPAPRIRPTATTATLTAAAVGVRPHNTSALAPECGQWGASSIKYSDVTKDLVCDGRLNVKNGTSVLLELTYNCVTNGAPCVTSHLLTVTRPDGVQQSFTLANTTPFSYPISLVGTYHLSVQASCNSITCPGTCSYSIISQ
jgi:sugar lactone lactonase YvrE